ncbi:MAG: sensor histidine kinase [Bacilli bacterium]
MWICSNRRRLFERRSTLTRDLYARYLAVVAVLLVLVAAIQFESLHSALVVAGESSLSFALRDALAEPRVTRYLTPADFHKAVPLLLEALSIRGINVRIYNARWHPIGERQSHYDPVHLQLIRRGMTATMKADPISPQAGTQAFVAESHGQILLFANVGRPFAPRAGYVELGYPDSTLYPILLEQAAKFFLVSVIVVVFAAAILIPVVRAPLRPLHRLIQTALRIRAGAFQERLPLLGTHETVRLAGVINDALDLLADAVKREQDATGRMKQFVSDASHELRTPLTAIRGFTDVLLRRVESYSQELNLLQQDMGEEGEREELSRSAVAKLLLNAQKLTDMRQGLLTVASETGRLEALVKDLLQLAKLGEGISPHFERLDLSALVAEMRPQFDILAEQRVVGYDLQPAVTKCDKSMIQQILYNIVINSIQHTPKDTGRLWICVEPLPDQRARLTVRDNGPGIAKEQLDRIFDRFYRASGARERHPGGAGLGLAIVAEIVRAHNGVVKAESELGVGTRMIVEL